MQPQSLVREATLDDMERLLVAAEEIHGTSRYSHYRFDPATARRWYEHLINSESAIVLISQNDGVFCGVLSPTHFNDETVFALELAWGGADGAELLKAARDWAKSSGASELVCAAEAVNREPAVSRYYRVHGAERVASTHVWRL